MQPLLPDGKDHGTATMSFLFVSVSPAFGSGSGTWEAPTECLLREWMTLKQGMKVDLAPIEPRLCSKHQRSLRCIKKWWNILFLDGILSFVSLHFLTHSVHSSLANLFSNSHIGVSFLILCHWPCCNPTWPVLPQSFQLPKLIQSSKILILCDALPWLFLWILSAHTIYLCLDPLSNTWAPK